MGSMAGKGMANSGMEEPSGSLRSGQAPRSDRPGRNGRSWTVERRIVNPVTKLSRLLRGAVACCEALALCPHRVARPRWPAHSMDRPMAQTSNRLMDELARLATDAVGAAQGVRREVETVARSQMERLIRDMDVATREEVEVLREMV